MFLSPNTLLRNRYLIVRKIGHGGMGAVYEAKDQRLGHRVAVKQMTLSDETLVKAFEREGRMLAQLDHPVLPHVSDFFISDETHFLVMKYISGDDLKESLDKRAKPFPVEKVVEWLDQLLDGLEYLHSHSPPIIHRDIKPANLKLSSQGTIILLDFGISKGGQLDQTLLTTTNKSLFAFTLRYAPLEQMDGQGTDARSDLYSLAATFYHLLTATQLPTATTRAHAQIKYTPDPLLPANQINPKVPQGLAALLSQAMALDPDNRPQSAKAMRAALRQAMSSSRQPAIINKQGPAQAAQIPANSSTILISQPAKSEISPPPSFVTPPPVVERQGLGPLGIFAVLLITVLSVALLLMVVSQFSSSTGERAESETEEPVAVISTATTAPLSTATVAPSPTIKASSTIEPEPATLLTSTSLPLIELTLTASEPLSTTKLALTKVEPTLTIELTSTEPSSEPTLEPELVAGASRVSEKDEMTQLYVPAGEFLMGSKKDDPLVAEHEHETPQRTIFLDDFWIDQTEVTNAMFARFIEETEHETYAEKERESYVYVGEGSWEKIDGASWRYPRGTECDCEVEEIETHPVVQVTWDDARLYCEWAGRRLPTEAEWEKAARGPDGALYPWGDAELAGNLLNVCDGSCPLDWANDSYDDRFEFTAPVGNYSLGASPYGALDMMGNVWEWVGDWYDKDYYEEMPERNPPGPESRQERVLRGGSWSSGAGWVRTSFRHRDPPTDPNDERGFRCASSP